MKKYVKIVMGMLFMSLVAIMPAYASASASNNIDTNNVYYVKEKSGKSSELGYLIMMPTQAGQEETLFTSVTLIMTRMAVTIVIRVVNPMLNNKPKKKQPVFLRIPNFNSMFWTNLMIMMSPKMMSSFTIALRKKDLKNQSL